MDTMMNIMKKEKKKNVSGLIGVIRKEEINGGCKQRGHNE